jgi:hypothetical protein
MVRDGANAPPHHEGSGADQDCDGSGHNFAFPRQKKCPGDTTIAALEDQEGAGRPDAPVAPAARMQKKNAAGTPKHRHSLRNGLRLIRALLGVPGLLASVTCPACRAREGRHRQPTDLIPASGDRDHATSLVRGPHRSSCDTAASIAPRLAFRDDRDTPLLREAGCAQQIMLFRKTEERYFTQKGLTHF